MSGYKSFTRGETLTALDVNDNLMLQSVMVFDAESDRSTSLAEVLRPGITTFIKSTGYLEIYNGSSWVRIFPYASLPTFTPSPEVEISRLMHVADPDVVNITEEPLFYDIFSNFGDGTWVENIW